MVSTSVACLGQAPLGVTSIVRGRFVYARSRAHKPENTLLPDRVQLGVQLKVVFWDYRSENMV